MAKTLCVKNADFSTNKVTTVSFGSTPCTGISFSQNTFNLTDYTPVSIGYTLTPANTTDTLSWASSDTDVVTVDGGVITAVGLGTATITATCGTQTATATVSVALSYIPDCEFVKRSYNAGETFVANSNYTTGIGCFGKDQQAGTYISPKTSTGYDKPVIKLPKNTASVTISYSNIGTTLYYGNNTFTFWLKDEPCGNVSLPTAAKYISAESDFNARTAGDQTFNVPEGADSMLLFIRLDSAPASGTATDLAETIGLTITFNAAS